VFNYGVCWCVDGPEAKPSYFLSFVFGNNFNVVYLEHSLVFKPAEGKVYRLTFSQGSGSSSEYPSGPSPTTRKSGAEASSDSSTNSLVRSSRLPPSVVSSWTLSLRLERSNGVVVISSVDLGLLARNQRRSVS
jgi:hypothetical protein